MVSQSPTIFHMYLKTSHKFVCQINPCFLNIILKYILFGKNKSISI